MSLRLAAAALILGARAAEAAPELRAARPQVAVQLPDCANQLFDVPSYVELLRVELAQDGVGDVQIRAGGAAQAFSAGAGGEQALLSLQRARCVAEDTHFVLHLADPLTDKAVARGVDLGSTPPTARSRMLALASAELLRASWAELALSHRRVVIESVTRLSNANYRVALHPEVRVPRTEEAVAEPAKATTLPPVTAAWRLGGVVRLRSFAQTRTSLSGGGIAACHAGEWTPCLDATVTAGEVGDALGAVKLLSVSLQSAALRTWRLADDLTLGLGPSVTASYVHMRGEASSTAVQASGNGAAAFFVGMQTQCAAEISKRVHAQVAFDAGYTVVGVSALADTRRVSALEGGFLGASVGISGAL